MFNDPPISHDSLHDIVKTVDIVCFFLFDQWCERRNMTALCYLLNSWPLREVSYSSIHRLVRATEELQKLHPDIIESHLVPVLKMLPEDAF